MSIRIQFSATYQDTSHYHVLVDGVNVSCMTVPINTVKGRVISFRGQAVALNCEQQKEAISLYLKEMRTERAQLHRDRDNHINSIVTAILNQSIENSKMALRSLRMLTSYQRMEASQLD